MATPDLLNPVANLTERQLEILRWVAVGRLNREIAIIFDLSIDAIKKHLFRTYRTLGVANRVEAINCLREWEERK